MVKLVQYIAACVLICMTVNTYAQSMGDAVSRSDTALVLSLLKGGVNINVPDGNGSVPIAIACRYKVDTAFVSFLLKHGADAAGPVTPTGRTALIVTCTYYGGAGVCRILVRYGAKVNAVTKAGATALMLAAQNGKADVVQYLLSQGADAGAKDASGKTALDYAQNANITDDIIKSLPDCRVSKAETVQLLQQAMKH